MAQKMGMVHNGYQCALERNQAGKYCMRIRAHFPRHAWTLSAYFLASSFDRAMKKLEECLQYLQKHEDRLWFWGVDRSDDPGIAAELLRSSGLRLDRRAEFPRKSANVSLPPERTVPAFALAPVRRGLAESLESPRGALAGD
jgi:hypothetical protein